jgi:hypothetical protein
VLKKYLLAAIMNVGVVEIQEDGLVFRNNGIIIRQ